MSQHAPALFAALHAAALNSPGVLDPEIRRAAAADEPLPEPMQRFASQVRSEAATIEDGDLAPLRAAGLPEDAIFELAVAVAVGAADRRLRAARAALDGGAR